MLEALVLVAASAVSSFIGYRYGYRRGYRLGVAHGAAWLVRPHTASTAARMPLPEHGQPTVSQAAFVRTNLPGSTSTME